MISVFYILRYDYLEFTDSRGGKVRYDMKVGTEKWPKVGYESKIVLYVSNNFHMKYYCFLNLLSLLFPFTPAESDI